MQRFVTELQLTGGTFMGQDITYKKKMMRRKLSQKRRKLKAKEARLAAQKKKG